MTGNGRKNQPATGQKKIRTDLLKKKIFEGLIEEFSLNGFDKASTNRVAKKLKISKGLLFYYYGTKEAMLYAVLEHTVNLYGDYIGERTGYMPPDIIDRFKAMVRISFDFYFDHPELYTIFANADLGKRGKLFGDIYRKFSGISRSLIAKIFEDASEKDLRIPKEEVLELVTTLIAGYKLKYFGGVDSKKKMDDLITLKPVFIKDLDTLFDMIRNGVYYKYDRKND